MYVCVRVRVRVRHTGAHDLVHFIDGRTFESAVTQAGWRRDHHAARQGMAANTILAGIETVVLHANV